jgi:hypothetical protein
MARFCAAHALATLGADGDRYQDEVAQSGAVQYLVQMLHPSRRTQVRLPLSNDEQQEEDARCAALECIAVIAHGNIQNATALGSGAIQGACRALEKRGGLRARAVLCLAALVASAANKALACQAGLIPLLLLCSQEAAEDQDTESLGHATVVLAELGRAAPSCQTQLTDYSTIEKLEAYVAALLSRIDPSTQLLIDQLSDSLADERQRRTLYEIERDAQPCPTKWSVGALASWVAAPEVGLPAHAQSFRRLDLDGPTFVMILRGSGEWTLVELWQELGIEQHRDQTIILDAMRSRGQTMNALAPLLSATMNSTISGKFDPTRAKTLDQEQRYSRGVPTWLERAAREVFWVVRLARRAFRPRQKQLLRMILPLYMLYYTIPWLLIPLQPPPPPPPLPLLPPPLGGVYVELLFSQHSRTVLGMLLWTVVLATLILYRIRYTQFQATANSACGTEVGQIAPERQVFPGELHYLRRSGTRQSVCESYYSRTKLEVVEVELE